MVRIPLPPPARNPDPVHLTLAENSQLIRIYNPNSHGATPLTFRSNGPGARFDHHKASADSPSIDPERGITYAAFNLSGCIVEVFGDLQVIACEDWHVVRLTVGRKLKLIELRDNGAMRAETVSAIGSVVDRVITQMWSRYFYESAPFQNADGLVFSNAHNGEPAIALYERSADALQCGAKDIMRLDSNLLRADLIEIAIKHNMLGPI